MMAYERSPEQWLRVTPIVEKLWNKGLFSSFTERSLYIKRKLISQEQKLPWVYYTGHVFWLPGELEM